MALIKNLLSDCMDDKEYFNFNVKGKQGQRCCAFCGRWARSEKENSKPLKLSWLSGPQRSGYTCVRCAELVTVLARMVVEKSMMEKLFKRFILEKLDKSLTNLLFGQDLNTLFRNFLFSYEVIEELRTVLLKVD